MLMLAITDKQVIVSMFDQRYKVDRRAVESRFLSQQQLGHIEA